MLGESSESFPPGMKNYTCILAVVLDETMMLDCGYCS